jgi:hypothetical protein
LPGSSWQLPDNRRADDLQSSMGEMRPNLGSFEQIIVFCKEDGTVFFSMSRMNLDLVRLPTKNPYLWMDTNE